MKNLDALRGTGKTKPGLEVVSSGQFLKAGIPAETYSCFWSVVDTAAVDSCTSTGVGTGFPVMTDEVCSDIAELDDDGGDCARSAKQKYLKKVDKRCEEKKQVDKNFKEHCENEFSDKEAANLKDFEDWLADRDLVVGVAFGLATLLIWATNGYHLLKARTRVGAAVNPVAGGSEVASDESEGGESETPLGGTAEERALARSRSRLNPKNKTLKLQQRDILDAESFIDAASYIGVACLIVSVM